MGMGENPRNIQKKKKNEYEKQGKIPRLVTLLRNGSRLFSGIRKHAELTLGGRGILD